MIPPKEFLDDLYLVDGELFVRWEVWKAEEEDADGDVHVTPYNQTPKRVPRESLKADGRWRIYHRDRHGRPYFVMEVCGQNGEFVPLNKLVIAGLYRRKNVWDKLDELTRTASEARAAEARNASIPEADEVVHDGLEQTWRDAQGMHRHALGAPGAPAAPKLGYYSQDRRRFAHYLENPVGS